MKSSVYKKLEHRVKPYLQQHYQVYHGMLDLYGYFIELGLRLLKPGGRLGYICSSTFFKTGSGVKLRELLLQQTSMEAVVDFGDLQVFAGVTTYPAIIVVRKNTTALAGVSASNLEGTDVALVDLGASPISPVSVSATDTTIPQQMQTLVLGTELPADLRKYFAAHATVMPQASLSTVAWRLEGTDLVALRHKLVAGKPTLREVYGAPLYGIKTGLNKAFVIDRATQATLVKEDPRSVELLRPFLEGKDLKRWHVEERSLALITIPKGWTRQQIATTAEAPAWAWFTTNYPTLARHLQPYADKAKKRRDKGDFWWELRACSYYEEFEKPKLVYAHFQSTPLFSMVEPGLYCNNKAYIAPSMNFYELGLLNSTVMPHCNFSITHGNYPKDLLQ